MVANKTTTHQPLFGLGYEQEAIDFLRSNLNDVAALVCTSGGKDSICIEHLMKLSGLPYTIQSTLTGIDPPQVIRFIRKQYPSCQFVKPKQSFWHLLTTHNPPAGTGRGIKWCCTKIKENPSACNPIKHRILGIRAEESPSRKKYGYINIRSDRDQVHYHPIFHWKEWQVWEFIKKYNLPYPTLYDEGFSRIGCVVCPNHQKHHDLYRNRWPNYFKCFEKYVNVWWHKRQSQGRDMYHNSPEEFLKDWYAGKFYYYKHKERSNKQKRLFD